MMAMPKPIEVPLHTDKDGIIRVGKTRVTLQTVIIDFNKGASPEEIVHHYPALTLSDVYLVIGYYLQNLAGVDEYVRDQQERSLQAHLEYEAKYPNDPLRAKLLKMLEARRKQQT
jgi:uncharacterized protein (DUF433 family)